MKIRNRGSKLFLELKQNEINSITITTTLEGAFENPSIVLNLTPEDTANLLLTARTAAEFEEE